MQVISTSTPQEESSLNRRCFLTGFAKIIGGVGLSTVPLLTTKSVIDPILFPKTACEPPLQTIPAHSIPEMALSFYNRHTGESLKNCAFWIEGKFNPEALRDINKLFRDHRTNTIHPIDRDLLKLLHRIHDKLDTNEPFHLISGYRSPKSNNMLASNSNGVAKRSLHLVGKAADIYVPGRSLKQVQGAAKTLKYGGVGRYTQFVHVDTGRVRYWGL